MPLAEPGIEALTTLGRVGVEAPSGAPDPIEVGELEAKIRTDLAPDRERIEALPALAPAAAPEAALARVGEILASEDERPSGPRIAAQQKPVELGIRRIGDARPVAALPRPSSKAPASVAAPSSSASRRSLGARSNSAPPRAEKVSASAAFGWRRSFTSSRRKFVSAKNCTRGVSASPNRGKTSRPSATNGARSVHRRERTGFIRHAARRAPARLRPRSPPRRADGGSRRPSAEWP